MTEPEKHFIGIASEDDIDAAIGAAMAGLFPDGFEVWKAQENASRNATSDSESG